MPPPRDKVWNDIRLFGTRLQVIRVSQKWEYDPGTLAAQLHETRRKVVLTSGGFDPLHVGHVSYLRAAKELGDIHVVVVNSDRWLLAKKGYVFMPLRERMEIIAAVEVVDYVTWWDDGGPFVDGAIRLLNPDVFAKGGDRSAPADVAECEKRVCEEMRTEVRYGVGGSAKTQSSSELVKRCTASKT